MGVEGMNANAETDAILESLIALARLRGAAGIEVLMLLSEDTCVYRVTSAFDEVKALAASRAEGGVQ